MQKIKEKRLCRQCRSFNCFDIVTECDLGRVREFNEEGGLTECEYWESKKMKKIICIDFDGVLNNYKYYDEDELFTPREGAKEFLENLAKDYIVFILTARNFAKVERWLNKYDMMEHVAHVTNIKPPATVYLDDRAVRYDGDFNAAEEKIRNFKTFWEEE